jgi:choline dehydrogenase-like flavoprotein
VRDSFHPAGTTRMSDGPASGVVDRNLAVHGVPGLYVVGGSVFPTSGYANPTLTIVALALRLSAHLHRVVR